MSAASVRWEEFKAYPHHVREQIIRRTVTATVELLKVDKYLRKESKLAEGPSVIANKITESLCEDFKSTWATIIPMTLDFVLVSVPAPHMTIHLSSETLGVDLTVEVPSQLH